MVAPMFGKRYAVFDGVWRRCQMQSIRRVSVAKGSQGLQGLPSKTTSLLMLITYAGRFP